MEKTVAIEAEEKVPRTLFSYLPGEDAGELLNSWGFSFGLTGRLLDDVEAEILEVEKYNVGILEKGDIIYRIGGYRPTLSYNDGKQPCIASKNPEKPWAGEPVLFEIIRDGTLTTIQGFAGPAMDYTGGSWAWIRAMYQLQTFGKPVFVQKDEFTAKDALHLLTIWKPDLGFALEGNLVQQSSRAEIRVGDRIQYIDNAPLCSDELAEFLVDITPSDYMTVDLVRDSEPMTLHLMVGAKDRPIELVRGLRQLMVFKK